MFNTGVIMTRITSGANSSHFMNLEIHLTSVCCKIMERGTKLILVKSLHTVIWVFFNMVIFYMLYAALSNQLGTWLWLGYGLVCTEGIVLLIFKLHCPLSLVANKYSESTKDNFDIYLPNWLAKYTKLIYTSLMLIIVGITIYQLLK
jgi:hypothetical protein